VGWRFPFVVMGLVAMLVGYVFLQVVRDAPPDVAGGAEEAEASAGIWRGLGQVLTTPGLVQVFCLYMVAFASLVTVQVVWAGPYLHDVYGLGPVERGNVLIGMALVQTMGVLVVGPLDRLFNTRKWVSVGSGCLALLAMTALALGPTSLPTAIGFLFLLSGSSAYGGVLFAQIRSLFPAHLAGRSATITNMAPLFGASVLPTLTGFIPPLFPHDASGYAPLAYQCIFATLAFCLAAGLGVYLTVEDTKPSPVEDAGSSAPRPDTG
jgi:predicted MFS family arabinose efflux permease